MSKNQLAQYLSDFSSDQKQRLIIHGYPDIAKIHNINKVHYSTHMRNRNSQNSLEKAAVISSSTHSWEEFNALKSPITMAFIGPVFPSISKPGYIAKHQIIPSERKNFNIKAIALGGLSSFNIKSLSDERFDDFAICGSIWHASSPMEEAKECHRLIREIQNKQSSS